MLRVLEIPDYIHNTSYNYPPNTHCYTLIIYVYSPKPDYMHNINYNYPCYTFIYDHPRNLILMIGTPFLCTAGQLGVHVERLAHPEARACPVPQQFTRGLVFRGLGFIGLRVSG